MPVPTSYISVETIDGLNLYAIFERESDLFDWNTFAAAFESFQAGRWYNAGSNTYAIAAAATVISPGVAARYDVAVPSMAAGTYRAKVYVRQGATPAASDAPAAWTVGNIQWNGTALVPSVNQSGNPVMDVGTNGDKTGYALSATTIGTVPSGSAPALAGSTILMGVNYPLTQAFSILNYDASGAGGWTQIDFTVKNLPVTDADSAAKLLVKVTNPAAGTDGLLLLNGAAPSGATTAADGTITGVTATTTALSFTLNLTARGAALAAGSYAAEVTVYKAGGKQQWFGQIQLDAEQTVRSNPTTS